MIRAAERVVLPQHPRTEERQHHPGLHTRAPREHRGERTARTPDPERPAGQLVESRRGRTDPARPVHDVGGQQRQVDTEPGEFPDVPLGVHGQTAQFRHRPFGLGSLHHRATPHEAYTGRGGHRPVDQRTRPGAPLRTHNGRFGSVDIALPMGVLTCRPFATLVFCRRSPLCGSISTLPLLSGNHSHAIAPRSCPAPPAHPNRHRWT